MKTDTYHAFMLDHAAGALAPALHLAGDLHRSMHPRGAGAADLWDCIGGVLLEETLDAPLRNGSRRSGLRRERLNTRASDILAIDLDALDWKRGLSGVDYARTSVPMGQFMRLQPGQKTVEHGHSALEATVVLQGSLFVDGRNYGSGDLIVGAPGERHQPEGGADGVCVCYVGRERRPFWRFS